MNVNNLLWCAVTGGFVGVCVGPPQCTRTPAPPCTVMNVNNPLWCAITGGCVGPLFTWDPHSATAQLDHHAVK